MKRRRLYQMAVRWLAEGRDIRRIVMDFARAMRRRRGMAAGGKAAAWEEDAEIQTLLDREDALGMVYQALRAPELEAAYRASAGRKFKEEEIAAVTQLFTPDWVVRFLVQNTLGKLWMGMHPESGLRLKMDLLAGGEIAEIAVRPVREIRVCDPACGTMNFGLAAIDLLVEMYREEADCAGRRGWPAEPSDIRQIGRNLMGIDIDPLALQLAKISLAMKLRGEMRFCLHRRDALLDQGIETGCFDVVVTNPPYLSSRNVAKATVQEWKKRYPAAWRDAYACFLLRSMELLRNGGRVGILAMHSFMFTGGFEKLRKELTDQAAIEAVAHFGPGIFEVGNPGTLQTAAVVMRKEAAEAARDGQEIAAWRLVECAEKEGALRRTATHRITQKELKKLPRGAWAYWATGAELRAFARLRRLGEVSPPRQGLATTDNSQFVRYWWEVEPPGFAGPRTRWVPYVKSGRFRRWYEAPRHRVDWEDDGQRIKRSIVERYPYLNGKWEWVAKNTRYYGRAGITYSYLTSGSFSARQMEAGAIFDVAGSSLFPDDPLVMLAILNSSAAARLLGMINPTVNFQVGDLRQLPIPSGGEELRPLVSRCIELQKTMDSFDETTTDFVSPPQWDGAEETMRRIRRETAELEARIDQGVWRLYGLGRYEAGVAEEEEFDRVEWARRWVSFGLRRVLGKERVIDERLASEIRGCLPSEEIEEAVGSLTEFLAGPFEAWHGRLYRNRPIFRIERNNGEAVISVSRSGHR
ncbi:MAG TPA: N-6 DNA methylase [Tepidisphaeraceae bacterium]|nr:N-6 DNA methylase [Tepidisphaeraceae bacterium]